MLENADSFSTEKLGLVASKDLDNNFYADVFQPILHPTLSQQPDGRTTWDSAVVEALGNGWSPAGVLDLPVPKGDLSHGYRFIANLIVQLARQQQFETLEKLVGPTTPFKEILSLQGLHEALVGRAFRYSAEQKMADRRVSLVSRGLVRTFDTYLEARLTDEELKQVQKIITK